MDTHLDGKRRSRRWLPLVPGGGSEPEYPGYHCLRHAVWRVQAGASGTPPPPTWDPPVVDPPYDPPVNPEPTVQAVRFQTGPNVVGQPGVMHSTCDYDVNLANVPSGAVIVGARPEWGVPSASGVTYSDDYYPAGTDNPANWGSFGVAMLNATMGPPPGILTVHSEADWTFPPGLSSELDARWITIYYIPAVLY